MYFWNVDIPLIKRPIVQMLFLFFNKRSLYNIPNYSAPMELELFL
jgi:hypothetical protein